MLGLPTSPATRYKSTEWTWAVQRRFGLHVTAALPTLELRAAQGDTSGDPLGDTITGDPTTDKAAPHDAAPRVWHDAHQATATGAVIMGDKEKAEVFTIYKEGCTVDLAEEGMGKGGGDLCVEVKVWNSLVRESMSAPHETMSSGNQIDVAYWRGTETVELTRLGRPGMCALIVSVDAAAYSYRPAKARR